MRTLMIMALALWAAQAQAQPRQTATTTTPARTSPNGVPVLQIPVSSGQADNCASEASGAYANPMLAVTIDIARRDRVCSLLRQAKHADDIGRADLDYQIMCGSADWHAADAKTTRLCR